MKVSEAIEELKVGDTVWVKTIVTETDKTDVEPLYVCPHDDEYVWLSNDVEISLTEPQAEKVEVSQEFADWVEKAMAYQVMTKEWCLKEIANMGWGDWLHDPQNGEKYPCDDHWSCEVSMNKEKHIKAIYDCYTVKPNRWVVKDKDRHDAYINGLTIAPAVSRSTICGKENAYTFTDKAKAEAVATLVEGTVEEV